MISIQLVCPKCHQILKSRWIKSEDFKYREFKPIKCPKCKIFNMEKNIILKPKEVEE